MKTYTERKTRKYTRIAAMFMVLLLVMTFVKPLYADETTGSIRISGVEAGRSAELYKIFDLTYEGAHVAYTIDTHWSGFFTGDGAEYIVESNNAEGTLNPIIIDGSTRYINITESNAAAFADDALAYALTLEPDATQTSTDGEEMVFENLALGYYLIYPVGATELSSSYSCVCSLDSTVPDATVNVKAVYPSITKSEVTSVVSADVGQDVEYLIKGEVPNTTGYTDYTYGITDTMTNMMFNKDLVIKINGTVLDEEYYTLQQNNSGFTLVIHVMDLQELRGREIQLAYSGRITENAVVDGATNSAALTYSSNPDRWEETVTTPSDTQSIYSSQIIIDKQDSATGRKLAGASFILKNAEGKYYQYDEEQKMVSWTVDKIDAMSFTSDDLGYAKISGLADGTYYLTETQAPDGYNKLTEDVVIQIQGNEKTNTGASYTAIVKNSGGVELPSTGGIGTTIFYTSGIVLIGISLLSLLVKNRKLVSRKTR